MDRHKAVHAAGVDEEFVAWPSWNKGGVLSIKSSIYKGFSMAMLNNQMVISMSIDLEWTKHP